MATQYLQWEDTWTATTLAGTSVADGANGETGAISADQKYATLISVEIAYGATVNESAEVLVLTETDDGPGYEAEADQPTTIAMPATASTTHKRTFTLRAESAADFKIAVSNGTGASITATVRYKQATLESV